MSRDWGGPSSARASVATIRSVERYRCCGGAEEEVVEVQVGAEVLALPRGVGPVHVHEGGVEVSAGTATSSSPSSYGEVTMRTPGVVAEEVGAEPDAGRQERHPPGGRLQAEQEHALVVGLVLDGAGLAGGAEVRLERDRVERHEGVDEALHLAGGAQQADVGAALADDGEVGEVGAQDRPHDATSACAASPTRRCRSVMPDRSSATTSSSVQRLSFTRLAHVLVSVSRLATKASRCSSATPERLSSKVKPCSKR